MPLLDHSPNAPEAQLTADCDGTDLTAQCSDLTGWPTGGPNGKFYVTFGRGTPSEQRDLAATRSGNVLTFSGTGDRGVEGGSSVLQPTGTKVTHSYSMQEAKDANDHIFDWTRDDHPQYLTDARHTLIAHTQAMMGANSIGTAQLIDLNVSTAKLANLGVTSGKIADLAVITSKLADLNVTSGKLADLAVTTAKIANLGVTGGKIADLTITSGKLAAASVIAGKIAAGGVSSSAEITDAIVTLAKFASEASSDFTPTAGSFSSGNNLAVGTGGTTYGHYFKLGRLTVGWCGFNMAADGNLPSGSSIRVPLPLPSRVSGADGQRGFVAARARRSADGFISSGTGVITSATQFGQNIATAGASAEWDATVPFNWGTPGDGAAQLDAIFFYEAAA